MYQHQIADIQAVELYLQHNWNCQVVREALNTAQAKLQEIRQARLNKQFDSVAAKWTRVGADAMPTSLTTSVKNASVQESVN